MLPVTIEAELFLVGKLRGAGWDQAGPDSISRAVPSRSFLIYCPVTPSSFNADIDAAGLTPFLSAALTTARWNAISVEITVDCAVVAVIPDCRDDSATLMRSSHPLMPVFPELMAEAPVHRTPRTAGDRH